MLWKGPEEDGITYSLLAKFIVCRERFRLRVIEGVREPEAFDERLFHTAVYGSIFHEMMDYDRANEDWIRAGRRIRDAYRSEHPAQADEINKLYLLSRYQYPAYKEDRANDREYKDFIPLMQEVVFNEPYRLPSGTVIYMRGKIDGINYHRKSLRLWGEESKTKGYIDSEGISGSLKFNCQTMFYNTVLRTAYVGGNIFIFNGKEYKVTNPNKDLKPVEGVIYNVVRRPLSSKFGLRQKKKESLTDFCKRAANHEPEQSFRRFRAVLNNRTKADFDRRTLNNLLQQLVDWYAWVKKAHLEDLDPFSNPIHYQTPFGIYNSLYGGFRGDYFDYLARGRNNLEPIETLFRELG